MVFSEFWRQFLSERQRLQTSVVFLCRSPRFENFTSWIPSLRIFASLAFCFRFVNCLFKFSIFPRSLILYEQYKSFMHFNLICLELPRQLNHEAELLHGFTWSFLYLRTDWLRMFSPKYDYPYDNFPIMWLRTFIHTWHYGYTSKRGSDTLCEHCGKQFSKIKSTFTSVTIQHILRYWSFAL